MLINQNGYTPSDNPAGVPLIGYDNLIVSYVTNEAAAGHPADNMGDAATATTWQSTTAAAQTIQLNLSNATINYLGIAKHSLFDTASRISVSYTDNIDAAAGTLKALLHFDGPNGSLSIKDVSGTGEPWSTSGNAQIDTSQSKFGGSSCSFDGALSSFVQGYGGLFAFGTRNFTIDFWFRVATPAGLLFDTRNADAATAIALYINPTSPPTVAFYTNSNNQILGTTAISANTWYHLALCRSGTSTRMFVNGVQDGPTYTDANNYSLANTSYAKICGHWNSVQAGINGWVDEFRVVDGTAYFTANFTPPTAPYPDGLARLFSNYSTLLHFDGANGSTVFTDSGGEGHTWQPFGGAQISTAQSKFGGSSYLGNANAGLRGDGSNAFAFGLDDFTIDFYLRLNAINQWQTLYFNWSTIFDDFYLQVRGDTNQLIIQNLIVGTTVLAANQWYHVAMCRASGTTRLFLNGQQEGSSAGIINSLAKPNQPIIGNGAALNEGLNGYMDELRITKGTALFTRSFVPPSAPVDQFSARGGVVINGREPIVFRFAPIAPAYMIVRLHAAVVGPLLHTIGVMKAGNLLVLERGVKVDVHHDVLYYARKSSIVSGMSENGQFLGRIVLAEWREASAEFAWFTPAWYRANFEPFVKAALDTPFFWVWNPNEYPAETAYAWLSDDVRPETDPATRRIAATLAMRATT